MATNLSAFSLFVATPEQLTESRRRTYLQWGGEMSEAQYLNRDAFTDQFENARDGRLITWVMAHRDAPTSLDFVCSCETFRRDGLVWHQDLQADSDLRPPPKEVTCYAIASVFTPLANRGKGYARHMMRLLHWVIADTSRLSNAFPEGWGTPPGRVKHAGDGWFSALWSDVGKDFYRQCGPTLDQEGWIVDGAVSTAWKVSDESKSTKGALDDRWRLLDEDDVLKLWETDAENIANTAELSKSKQISLSFLPTKGVAAFQHRRNKVLLDQVVPTIEHWGVVSVDASAQSDRTLRPETTFATWTMEVRPPGPRTLLVTRLNSRVEDFEALLTVIMKIARKHGMAKVEVYSLPKTLQPTAASLGGTTFERDEHLSAFKWYGTEDTRDTAWLLNERFGWC